MTDVLIGGALGFAPFLFDQITGASRARRKILAEQDRVLQSMLQEAETEAGISAPDSALFRTGKVQLDRKEKQLQEGDTQDAAAGGLTEEAKLGRMTSRNETFVGAEQDLLARAEQERKRLKQYRRQLQLQRLGMQLGEADAASENLSKLSGGLLSIAPHILGGDTETATGDVGGENAKNTKKPYKKGAMSLLRMPYTPAEN